jgi:hypothetical protein
MIQSERRGLSVFPGLAKGLLARLNGNGSHQKEEVRQPLAAPLGPLPYAPYGDLPEDLDDEQDDLPF